MVDDFSEGRAAVMKNLNGFIDKSGKVCTGIKYDQIGNFSEGKAAVKVINYKDGLDEWVYIDKADNVVIDFFPYDASAGYDLGW